MTEPGGLPPNLPDPLDRAVEAVLFASAEPLTEAALARHLGSANVGAALDRLAQRHASRGFRLVERGGHWHFETAPDLAAILRREETAPRPLSRAATEVLAIIAYHEPVSRAEIEAIRGVATARGTLDVVMEAGWIMVAGRRESPGRPLTYATTPAFLSHFGLATRRDLPGIAELAAAGLLDPVEDALAGILGEQAPAGPGD